MTVTDPTPALISTLGGHYYTSATIFEAEQDQIFEKLGFCAARSSDLANPGQFKKVQIGRESVLGGTAEDELLDIAAQELIDEATRL